MLPVHPQSPAQPSAAAAAAGQFPLMQGRVGDNRNVVFPAVGYDIPLGAAAAQVVQNLVGHDGVIGQRRLRRRQIGDGKVADADLRHQAVVGQTGHGPHSFGDGNGRVGPVDLVEVNAVDGQQSQAAVGGAAHGVVAQVAAQHFGGDENLRADAGDGGAHGVLGAVHFGGVNKVGAQGDAPAQGFRPAGVAPGAEADFGRRYAGCAQRFAFHSVDILPAVV